MDQTCGVQLYARGSGMLLKSFTEKFGHYFRKIPTRSFLPVLVVGLNLNYGCRNLRDSGQYPGGAARAESGRKVARRSG